MRGPVRGAAEWIVKADREVTPEDEMPATWGKTRAENRITMAACTVGMTIVGLISYGIGSSAIHSNVATFSNEASSNTETGINFTKNTPWDVLSLVGSIATLEFVGYGIAAGRRNHELAVGAVVPISQGPVQLIEQRISDENYQNHAAG